MNANKRIAINAIATYSRTILGMALGLFSSRWVLQSLGEVDYGLMGVVGSIIVLITFLNTVLSGACARFFAYSIGKNDIEDLQRWFNIGVSVHLTLAISLVVIGAPIGEWAIDNFLSIPANRLETAHWVFRFSLVAAFWTMAATPYIAMYTATQNIAELTFWEIARILTNFGFVYWLTTYQGDSWFVYAGFTVFLTIALGMGQTLRARFAFKGCRINISYWNDKVRLKQMFSFVSWSLFGSLGFLARTQLPAILLNKYYPPINYKYVNASYQVGGALASYTQSLSSALMGAFSPQIATLSGAKNEVGVKKTAFRASKFGTFLTLLFAIPVALETDFLLVLWLKNPPQLASTFCRLVIIQMILDIMTFGHTSGIMASGNIKWYQITTGTLCMLCVPISWLVFELGGSPESVSLVIACCVGICSITRLFFGRKILDIKIYEWFKEIFMPLLLISITSAFIGYCVIFFISVPSLIRLCLTSLFSCSTMTVFAWFLLFDLSEREILKQYVNRIYSKIRK